MHSRHDGGRLRVHRHERQEADRADHVGVAVAGGPTGAARRWRRRAHLSKCGCVHRLESRLVVDRPAQARRGSAKAACRWSRRRTARTDPSCDRNRDADQRVSAGRGAAVGAGGGVAASAASGEGEGGAPSPEIGIGVDLLFSRVVSPVLANFSCAGFSVEEFVRLL